MLKNIFAFVFDEYERNFFKNSDIFKEVFPENTNISAVQCYDLFFRNKCLPYDYFFFESTMRLISKSMYKTTKRLFNFEFEISLQWERWRDFKRNPSQIFFNDFLSQIFLYNNDFLSQIFFKNLYNSVDRMYLNKYFKIQKSTKKSFFALMNFQQKNYRLLDTIDMTFELNSKKARLLPFLLSHHFFFCNFWREDFIENFLTSKHSLLGLKKYCIVFKDPESNQEKLQLYKLVSLNICMNCYLSIEVKKQSIPYLFVFTGKDKDIITQEKFECPILEADYDPKNFHNLLRKLLIIFSNTYVSKDFLYFYDSLNDQPKKLLYFLFHYLSFDQQYFFDACLASLHYLKKDLASENQNQILVKKESLSSLLSNYVEFFTKTTDKGGIKDKYNFWYIKLFIQFLIRKHSLKKLFLIFVHLKQLLIVIQDPKYQSIVLNNIPIITDLILDYINRCNKNPHINDTRRLLYARQFLLGFEKIENHNRLKRFKICSSFNPLYNKNFQEESYLKCTIEILNSYIADQERITEECMEKQKAEMTAQKEMANAKIRALEQEIAKQNTVSQEKEAMMNSKIELLMSEKLKQVKELHNITVQLDEEKRMKEDILKQLYETQKRSGLKLWFSFGLLLMVSCFAVYKSFSKKLFFA